MSLSEDREEEGMVHAPSPTQEHRGQGQERALCQSCFKTKDLEPVEVKRDGKWVASTVRRCANSECHAVREGTLVDRLDHIRSVYGYKYFGDYELSPEQLDAAWEAKALAERVPALVEALNAILHTYDDGGVPLGQAFAMANDAIAKATFTTSAAGHVPSEPIQDGATSKASGSAA